MPKGKSTPAPVEPGVYSVDEAGDGTRVETTVEEIHAATLAAVDAAMAATPDVVPVELDPPA